MITCTFAGHRDVFRSNIPEKIDTAISQIIEAHDDVVIPMELAGVHYKSAITKRNRWMVDESEYLIAYVYRDFGGAYTTLHYAEKQKKQIINLAEETR